ncbi:MAG TPA: ABC transporter permease [Acidimicrobiales bacterium]
MPPPESFSGASSGAGSATPTLAGPPTTVPPADTAALAGAEGAATAGERAQRLGWGAKLAIGWLVLVVAAALLAPVLPLDDPYEPVGAIARQGPGTDGHVLGGDSLGRDLLSRLVWGARMSLLISVTSVLLGMVLGGLLGLLAGYFRGRLDKAFVGVFDVLLSFPQLILALTLVTVYATGEGVSSTRRITVLIFALGVVSIPVLGRITRATTLTWSQRDFVHAARAMGARNRSIMFGEVLPNVLPAMFSIALLGIAVVIVAEGGLSLLGVGVQLPTPSWGNIIAEGRGSLRDAPHIVLAPTVAIFLTVLALNYLGDVVRARFDVRESAL